MNCLSVDGPQLRYQLSVIARRLRRLKPLERAQFGFDGVSLTIEARDTVCFVQAVGTWTGTARAPASLVAALAVSPPVGDRVELTCAEGVIRCGPIKVAATWLPISTTLCRMPPADDWLRGITLRHAKSRGELLREGLTDEVAAAERKLEQLADRAAKSLAATGVTRDDVRQLIERRLAERFADRGAQEGTETDRHE